MKETKFFVNRKYGTKIQTLMRTIIQESSNLGVALMITTSQENTQETQKSTEYLKKLLASSGFLTVGGTASVSIESFRSSRSLERSSRTYYSSR